MREIKEEPPRQSGVPFASGAPVQAEEIDLSDRVLPLGEIAFMSQFVSNAPAAIIMVDQELRVIAASHRFHSCFNLVGIKVVGRHLDDLFPDAPARWRKSLQKVMNGETLRCEKDDFLRSDGSIYWLRWEAMPYRLSDGVVDGCLVFIEPLTNEIDAATNLRLVLRSARLGVWERDLVLNKLHLTEQAEALLGYSPGTFGDDPETFDACVHPEDSAQICSAIEATINDRSAITVKFRVSWPDGSIHWLQATCESERSSDGVPIRLRGVSMDITDTHQQEIALKALTLDLERKVEERTRELQIATEAKSRFLANMSHEIRNPLNSVTILSKLLERQDLDPEKRKEFVRRITTATRTVTQILDEVLDFSKLEAGQTTLESLPFSLAEILNDLHALLEARADAKGITLEILPITCDCILLGDGKRIQQILVNLIGNAIKFTEKGGVVVKTHHERMNGDLLKVAPGTCCLWSPCIP